MKKLRKGRSFEEVAKAVEISAEALKSYESDERIPRDEVKIRLADYFGVKPGDIFLN